MKALLLWLTPDNVAHLVETLALLAASIVAVLKSLGLTRAVGVIGELKTNVETIGGALVVTAQGVEKVKATMSTVDADRMSAILKEHAEAAGVERVMAPIVTAVQLSTPKDEIVKKATGRMDAGHVADKADVANRVSPAPTPPSPWPTGPRPGEEPAPEQGPPA